MDNTCSQKTKAVVETREDFHFPFAREGFFLIGIGLAGVACGLFLKFYGFAGVFLLFTLFSLYFFRDPRRCLKIGPEIIISPADGRIIEVGRIREDNFLKAEVNWVVIFMSPLNVHVNRAPVTGRVFGKEKSGRAYLVASRPEAARRNVQVSLAFRMENGRGVMIKQIVGAVARRIVCHPQVGDNLRQGERIGLIRFGSRVEIFLPDPVRIKVRPGDLVRGGETIIGEW
ncbi:MAG: phosphatidylserine decarboxylase [bacterium]|nr:phosphatidylserine decarboxylase [bacterium]